MSVFALKKQNQNIWSPFKTSFGFEGLLPIFTNENIVYNENNSI